MSQTKLSKIKVYNRPHLVPGPKSPPKNNQGDTGISERARRYRKRCRNVGVPRYLSDAPDPVAPIPSSVKLLDPEKEIDLPDYVPIRKSKKDTRTVKSLI